MDRPMTFEEFIRGRVCVGSQARYDYEDYLRGFEEEEVDEDE